MCTKLHRQKHKMDEGSIGKANKNEVGRFLQFSAADCSMKVIVGDTRSAADTLKGEQFNLLVSDLPYGVQHFTTANTRNPLPVLQQSVEQWKQCLKPGAAIVLAFNNYLPRRTALVEAFESAGLEAQRFSAPHRMSESIVRDVVVFKAKS